MRAKDLRIKVITEAFHAIVSMKMTGLETMVLSKSNEYRLMIT